MNIQTVRQWFADLPIQDKLTNISMASIALPSVLAMLLLLGYTYYDGRRTMFNDAESRTQMIAQNIAPALLFNDYRSAQELITSLRSSEDLGYSVVYNQRGIPIAHFQRAGYSGHIARLPARMPTSGFSENALDIYIPVLAEKEYLGIVQTHFDLSNSKRHLQMSAIIIALSGFLAMALSGWVLKRLHHRITQPLSDLTKLIEKISSSGDYKKRASITTKDEIGTLTARFNNMLEQIENRETALSKEVVDRRKAEETLKIIAHFDSLTQLPNRHFFNYQLTNMVSDAKFMNSSCGVLFIDLDNFKYVNDNFGHPAGDTLLASVAERLKSSLRNEDVICRIGGDEFAVLVKSLQHKAHAEKVASKILQELVDPFQIEQHEIFISASIGIAIYPDHAEDADTLVRYADAAMYQVKQNGKSDHQFWHADLSAKSANRIDLEAQLRRALERNELRLHYQPIVDLAAQRIAGFEALIRWQHPDKGMVPPSDFIPIAEETSLILPISDWVLCTAAQQSAEWNARFGDIFIAVNLSGRQFHNPQLDRDILALVDRFGLQRHQLELELTEGILIEQTIANTGVLERLSEAGMKLSMDDFGTGYSSLSYLKRFPLTKLKIDRSFVSNLPDDKDDFAIVLAIVNMASALNLKTVAEGVETLSQAAILREIGCDFGQGYLFSKPVDALRAADLMEKYNSNPHPQPA